MAQCRSFTTFGMSYLMIRIKSVRSLPEESPIQNPHPGWIPEVM